MSRRSENVKRWRENTKNRIVQAFGGCCGKCGYKRFQDALELHHIDPTQKEFGIGFIMANIISWERICVELRKCVMVCSNCHKELHKQLWEITEDFSRFNEKYCDYKKFTEEAQNTTA